MLSSKLEFAMSELLDIPLLNLAIGEWQICANDGHVRLGYLVELDAALALKLAPFGGITLGATGHIFAYEQALPSWSCGIETYFEFNASSDFLLPIIAGTSVLAVVGLCDLQLLESGVNFAIQGQIRLNRSRIVGTKFIVSADRIVPELDKSRLRIEDFRIELPLKTESGAPLTIACPTAIFDGDGITALLVVDQQGSATWNPDKQKFNGTLAASMGGFAIALEQLSVSIVKNQLVNAAGTGKFRLPFFDKDLTLGLGVLPGGEWSLTIDATKVEPFALGPNPGLAWARVTLNTLTFVGDGLGIPKVAVDGTLDLHCLDRTITLPLSNLRIDAEGALELAGGWLPLPGPVSFMAGPFELQVSRLGLSNVGSGRQVALDAAVKLHDALPMSVSAKGLRVNFKDGWSKYDSLSFDGIGVSLTVPDVLEFSGSVSMSGEGKDTAFTGSIGVNLTCIDARLDGQLAFGQATDEKGQFRYMALHLAMDLSTGIALFGTGLSIYGFEGMFAWNFSPNRTPEESWYSLEGKDWFHKSPPGVTALSKWAPKRGSFALGAGVTLGTTTGNGKPFNGKFLLLVTLPGPVIFLEGRANFLRDRKELNKEPQFHAMAALDALAGTLQFGLDVKWRQPEGGQLIDLKGGAEAFFDFHNASKWYLKIGQETPDSARVKVKLVSFLEASAFMYVDMRHARFGASAGVGASAKWGPLSAGIKLQLTTLVDISWLPPQLQAQAAMYGKAWIKAFGYGLSLQVTAMAQVDAFRPFKVVGKASIKGKIPIYGKFKGSMGFTWSAPKGEQPTKPAMPAPRITCPLVSLSAGHRLAPTRWNFVPGKTLQPGKLADDARNLLPIAETTKLDLKAAPPADLPVLPLDSSFDLCFAQPVQDLVGVGLLSVKTLEPLRIGDSAQGDKSTASVTASLSGLSLERWTGSTWEVIASKTANDGIVAAVPAAVDATDGLWGVWAPAPAPDDDTQQAGLQQRFRLWECDPLAFAESVSGELGMVLAENKSVTASTRPPVAPSWTKYDFRYLASSGAVDPVPEADTWQPWTLLDGPRIDWNRPATEVMVFDASIYNAAYREALLVRTKLAQAVYPTADGRRTQDYASTTLADTVTLEIFWPTPNVSEVRIKLLAAYDVMVLAMNGNKLVGVATWKHGMDEVKVQANAMDRIRIQTWVGFFVLDSIQVQSLGSSAVSDKQGDESAKQAIAMQALWSSPAHVLPAWAKLRLLVQMDVSQQVGPGIEGGETRKIEQAIFFRTEGGPGLANLSVPGKPSQPDVPDLQQALQVGGTLKNVAGADTTLPVLAAPINLLDPYVLRAYPAKPTSAEDPAVAWRGDDVGFDLALGHVRQMYQATRSDLGIRVRLLSGAPLRDDTGIPLALQGQGAWLAPSPTDATFEQSKVFKDLIDNLGKGTGLDIKPSQMGCHNRIRWQGGVLPANAELVAEVVPFGLSDSLTTSGKSALTGWQANGEAQLINWQPMENGTGKWLQIPYLLFELEGDMPKGNRLCWAGLPGQKSPPAWSSLRAQVSVYSGQWLNWTGQVGLILRATADGASGLAVLLNPAEHRLRVVHFVNSTTYAVAAEVPFVATGPFTHLDARLDERELVVWTDGCIAVRMPVRQSWPTAGTVGLYSACRKTFVLDVPGLEPGLADLEVEDLTDHARPVLSHTFVTGMESSLQHLAALAPITWPYKPTPLVVPGMKSQDIVGATKFIVANGVLEPGRPDKAEADACQAVVNAATAAFSQLAGPPSGLQVVAGQFDDNRRFVLARADRGLDWRRTSLAVALPGETKQWQTTPAGARITGATFAADGTPESISVVPLGARGEAELQWLGIANPALATSERAPRLSSLPDDPAAGLVHVERFDQASWDLWQYGDPAHAAGSIWQMKPPGPSYITAVAPQEDGADWLAPVAPVDALWVRAAIQLNGSAAGVVLRASAPSDKGPQTRIRVIWDPVDQRFVVWQRLRNTAKELNTPLAKLKLADNKPLFLEVFAVGVDVLVFANGQLCGRHVDPSPQAGLVGVCLKTPIGTAGVLLTAFEVQTATGSTVRNRFAQLDPAQATQQGAPGSTSPVAVWTVAPADADASVPGLRDKEPSAVVKAAAPTGVTGPVQAVLVLPDLDLGSLRDDALLLSVDVQVPAVGSCGLLIGTQGTGLQLRLSAGSAKLTTQEAVSANLLTESFAVAAGSWVSCAVRIEGSHCRVWLNGLELAAVALPEGTSGGFGLLVSDASGGGFHAPCALQLGRKVGPWQFARVAAPPMAKSILAFVSGGLAPARTSNGALFSWKNTTVSDEVWLLGDSGWNDFAAEFQLDVTAGNKWSLVFDWSDSGNFRELRASGADYFIREWVNGKEQTVYVGAQPSAAGRSHLELFRTAGRARIVWDAAEIWNGEVGDFGGRIGLLAPVGSAPCCKSFSVRPATPVETAWTIADGNKPPQQGGLFARVVLPSTDAGAYEFAFAPVDGARAAKQDEKWLLRLTTSTEGCRLIDPSGASVWVAYPTSTTPQPLWMTWGGQDGLRVWLGNDEILWLPAFSLALIALPTSLFNGSGLPQGATKAQWLGDARLHEELFSDPMQWAMSSSWQTETPEAWTLTDGFLLGDATAGPISIAVGDESWKDYRVTMQLRGMGTPTVVELRQGSADGSQHVISLKLDDFGWTLSSTAHLVATGTPNVPSATAITTAVGGKDVTAALSFGAMAGVFEVRLGGKRVQLLSTPPTDVMGELSITVQFGKLALVAVSVQSGAWLAVASLSHDNMVATGVTASALPNDHLPFGLPGSAQTVPAMPVWPDSGPFTARLRLASQTLHQIRLTNAAAGSTTSQVLRSRDGSSLVLFEDKAGAWQGSAPKWTQFQSRAGQLLADGSRLLAMPQLGQVSPEAAEISAGYSSGSE